MADISQLAWMAGTWEGDLPPRQVNENWGVPAFGAMEARVRITDENGLTTVELIMIRETEGELELLLRQFDPDLDLKNNQNMKLVALEENSVEFQAEEGAVIAGLKYALVASDNMQVTVTLAGGVALTADLFRG